jgi:hypothetical protein
VNTLCQAHGEHFCNFGINKIGGMHKGAKPSCGGSRPVLAAWGEPSRPGFPREGKRERGDPVFSLPETF